MYWEITIVCNVVLYLVNVEFEYFDFVCSSPMVIASSVRCLILRVGYYDVGRVDLQGGNSHRPAQLQSSANGVCSSMKVEYFGLVAGLRSVVKLLGSREKLRWSRQAGQWHCAVC